MPHYTIKNKKGETLAIASAPSVAVAKAGAADLLLDVKLSSDTELLEAGRTGIELLKFAPKSRTASAPVVDPAQVDLEDEIAASGATVPAEPETAGTEEGVA
jgi:hypothetical protein